MSSPAPWDDARALLTAANLGVPIEWPNEVFSKPEPNTATGAGMWLVVGMTCDVLAPIELAGGAWQEDGMLFVTVMVPQGWGTRDARVLAKAVANVFRGLGPRNVVYHNASLGMGRAADTEGMWWALDVAISYRYQDH